MRNSQKTEGSFQLLRPREVEKLLGVRETTVWRLSRTPGFPKKYQVSANAVAWREDDIPATVRRQINPDQCAWFVRETSCRFTALRGVRRFSRLRCASVLRLTCARRARIAGRRPA